MGIINDILDFSKIESGKIELYLETFSLRESIDTVISNFAPMIHEKEILFESKIDANVPEYISSDKIRLNQIILNLLSNAVKFTPKKGKIDLSILVKSKVEDKLQLEFIIKDSGIGIEPEKLTELFKAFSQADSSITRYYGGTGLGLTISKKLTELLGGEIFALNNSDQGISFIFYITCSESLRSLEEVVSYPEINSSQRILIVDDNILNRQVLRKLLQNIHQEVEESESGRHAIQVLENQTFDLIFMDIQMPEIDGIQATKIIREKGIAIPIVALTANVWNEDRDACFLAGMNDFLTKPVDKIKLIQVLNKFKNT
ncbi:MAG: response regulator [Leptospiraceae bacterium]|nr:response regulator [Leptospiraceae bacterium]